jgi:hypothetical protein
MQLYLMSSLRKSEKYDLLILTFFSSEFLWLQKNTPVFLITWNWAFLNLSLFHLAICDWPIKVNLGHLIYKKKFLLLCHILTVA